MMRKRFGVTRASFLSNTQHPASFSPAWGGSSYPSTWRMFNLPPSPLQVRVFQTSKEGGGFVFWGWFFFYLPVSNTTCPFCPGAGWGAAPELAPLWPQAAAPLSKKKFPNTRRALKTTQKKMAFVLNYLQQGTKEGT